MASAYLTRTVTASTATSYTVSFWVKINNVNDTSTPYLWSIGSSAGNGIYLDSDGKIDFFRQSDTSYLTLYDGVLRDPSAWYHIVWSVNAGTGTAYVNGVTGNSHSSIPALNDNTGTKINIHSYVTGAYNTLDCCMAHFHFIDGTAYDASTFGETDSTSGIWKPKASPTGITYGTNGFFLKMENSGAMGTDSSGNSNTFTVSGTLTQNVDTASNNFATYNPLDNYYASSTFSNGNTTIVTNSGNTTYNTSTLGIPPTMKCYWETKFDTVQAANGEVGIVNTPTTGSAAGAYRLYYQTYGISVNDYGAIWSNNTNTGITLGTLSTSDIVCFAWDGVNQALYVRKNGDAWINSGDPTSGASKTGAVKTFTGTRTMFPAVGDQSGAHAVGTSTNFGNGYFGTTAISSEGSNASGIGKFEYDVPAGYTALSTKGLNE